MSIDFILSLEQAIVVAIALPIVTLCLFFLVIPWLTNGNGSRSRRYLSYLITPPSIDSDASTWRSDKVKLFFYYLGIMLFLTSVVIGEFYEVMIDLMLPVNQGSTGEMRIATSVIFQNPFSVQWLGSLPWMGVNTYHETWNWIFFTAAYTDNPVFLSTMIEILTLFSIGVGLVFLAPLAFKRIRQSFFPSMFFFITGMTIFSKAAVSWLGYGVALFFGNAELDYVTLGATGDMIPGLFNVIIIGFPIVLAMFSLFIVLGRKLWQAHYADSKSRTWFNVYIALIFWLGLAVTIMLV